MSSGIKYNRKFIESFKHALFRTSDYRSPANHVMLACSYAWGARGGITSAADVEGITV